MHKGKKYNYKINPEVNLAEQEISKEANAILITLFRTSSLHPVVP